MSPQRDVAELRMNAANLYREEMFTDRRVGCDPQTGAGCSRRNR